jgi:type II secretory pathway pseudopilin PulG
MKDGRKPPLKNILGRSLARYIPFEPFSFLTGSHPMGWHDRLSDTLVVPSNYTEEDVKKIDIAKVKKMGGGNTVVVVIVAIVGVLIVISIIGILSSVVLVSLGSARQKGQDAKIMSDLSAMRVNAETFYGYNNNSYSYAQNCNSGVFLKQNMQQLISDIPNKNVNCYAETSSYAISAKLATSDKSYCVDSSGYSNNGIAVDDGTTASCKLDASAGTNNTDSWQTFNSVQDNFSILLPSYPKFDSQQHSDSTAPYVTDSYESVSSGGAYYIYKYKYQSDINAKPEALLEASLNLLVNSDKNNKLVSSNLGVYGYYTSLDFHVSNNGDDIKGKIILENQSNMYLVMMESTDFDETNYNRFINSFTLK